MNFKKHSLKNIDRCYATGFTTVDQERRYLFATEGQGQCWQFSGGDFSPSPVWFGPGGTMCFVNVPGKNGDFLAVQNFFPTFDSKHAVIVWCQPAPERRWNITTVLNLPYVHRFDVLASAGVNYFLGCTLCSSKAAQDDWSDPGKIHVGVLPDRPDREIVVTPIHEGLVRNHGYCRGRVDGRDCGFVTGDRGILSVFPPEKPQGDWRVEVFSDQPTSDIAFCDIDGDGEAEWITIEPFHGQAINIYKRVGGKAQLVWSYDSPVDFGHAVWGGAICGRPAFLFGYRRLASEMVLVTFEGGKFVARVIEKGGGPANIAVSHEDGRDVIIVANRTTGEAALWVVME